MNNLLKHHSVGPQRCGAQCSCIGLRPAVHGSKGALCELVAVLHVNKSNAAGNSKRLYTTGVDTYHVQNDVTIRLNTSSERKYKRTKNERTMVTEQNPHLVPRDNS